MAAWLVLCAMASASLAQDTATNTTSPKSVAAASKQRATDAQQGNGFQIDAGYRSLLRGGDNGTYYYLLRYNGEILKQKNQPFEENIDLSGPVVPAAPQADTYDLSLRIERGVGEYDGPLADVLRVTDLRVPGIGGLRGAIQAYGTLNPARIDVAVGLETRSYHLSELGIDQRRLGVANFLIFGVQNRLQTRSTNDAQSAGGGSSGNARGQEANFLTYRAFFGKTLGMVRSDALTQSQIALKEDFAAKIVPTTGSPKTFGQFRTLYYGGQLKPKDDRSAGSKAAYEARLVGAPNFLLLPNSINPITGQAGPKEVDVQALLRDLRNARTGMTFTDRMHTKLRSYFGLDAPADPLAPRRARERGRGPAGNPSILPSRNLSESRAIVQAYDPNSGAPTQAISESVSRLLTEFLTKEGFQELVGTVPNETIKLAKDVLSDLGLSTTDVTLSDADKAFAQRILEIATGRDLPNSIAQAGVDKAEALDSERTFANRLLLERVFPSITGLPDVDTNGLLAEGGLPADASVWIGKIDTYIADATQLPDRPRAMLWFEGAGQYYLSGDPGNNADDQMNNIAAVTLTNYFNPGADKRNWIRLRWENGRDRTSPNQYRNQLTTTLGFEF